MKIHKKTFVSEKKDFNEAERTIKHYISTDTIDRYGEILNPKGMLDENYSKNPIVLYSHNLGFFSTPEPSKAIIGKSLYRAVEEHGVVAKTKFADTSLANDVMIFNKEGFMNTWSVGWMPLSEPESRNGSDYFKEWELLEYSAVIIPANPDAVNLMFKEFKSEEMKGILTNEYFNSERDKIIDELRIRLRKIEGSIDVAEMKKDLESRIEIISNDFSDKFTGIAGDIKQIKDQQYKEFVDSIPGIVTGAISKFLGKV